MMTDKEMNDALLNAFGIDPEAIAETLISKMEDLINEGSDFITDATIEAGEDLLPPGVTNQCWTGFVTGYRAGFVDGKEDAK